MDEPKLIGRQQGARPQRAAEDGIFDPRRNLPAVSNALKQSGGLRMRAGTGDRLKARNLAVMRVS